MDTPQQQVNGWRFAQDEVGRVNKTWFFKLNAKGKKSVSSETLTLLLQLCNTSQPWVIWGQSTFLSSGAMWEELCLIVERKIQDLRNSPCSFKESFHSTSFVANTYISAVGISSDILPAANSGEASALDLPALTEQDQRPSMQGWFPSLNASLKEMFFHLVGSVL